MQQKHKIIFEYMGGIVTAYKTQAEIAEWLQSPDVKLISVNDSGLCYRSKKRKGKMNGKNGEI